MHGGHTSNFRANFLRKRLIAILVMSKPQFREKVGTLQPCYQFERWGWGALAWFMGCTNKSHISAMKGSLSASLVAQMGEYYLVTLPVNGFVVTWT